MRPPHSPGSWRTGRRPRSSISKLAQCRLMSSGGGWVDRRFWAAALWRDGPSVLALSGRTCGREHRGAREPVCRAAIGSRPRSSARCHPPFHRSEVEIHSGRERLEGSHRSVYVDALDRASTPRTNRSRGHPADFPTANPARLDRGRRNYGERYTLACIASHRINRLARRLRQAPFINILG